MDYTLTLLEKHLDTFGHMNNATYLELFEEARWEVITQGGFGMKEIQATKLGPVILEVSVRFKRELRLRERITIKTRSERFKGKIGVIDQEMFNAAGECCCTASFKYGIMDLETRKLVEPTEKWWTALGI